MINIALKATGMELTPALRQYVEDKLQAVEKFIGSETATQADVEIGKTTHHHQSGDIFRCEINLSLPGDLLRAVAQKDDLYAAIDIAQGDLLGELRKRKGKRLTGWRKGARIFKDIVRRIGGGTDDVSA